MAPSSPSSTEHAAIDLKTAKLVVSKLGQVLGGLESEAFSVLALSQQWRQWEGSFCAVEASLSNRAKELESKERESAAASRRAENLQQEMLSRRSRLETAEKSLNERIKAVEIKENNIKEWCEVLTLEKTRIDDHKMALESKAKQLDDHCMALNAREKVIDERCLDFDAREKRIDDRCKDVEVREREVDKRCRSMLAKENKVEERSQAVDLDFDRMNKLRIELQRREKQIDDRGKALEMESEGFGERCKALEEREKQVDERRKAVEWRERQLDERSKMVDMKEMKIDELLESIRTRANEIDNRLKLVADHEARMDESQMELEKKERRINEQLIALELQEKEFSRQRDLLSLREKNLNELEEKVEANCKGHGSKEKELNEELKQLEMKQKEVNEHCQMLELWRQLELKVEEMKSQSDELKLELESKEKQVEERHKKLEVEKKQLDECYRKLELEKKEVRERYKRVERKEKELNERSQSVEIEQKQLNRRQKVHELKERRNEDSKALELKDKELEEYRQRLESKGKENSECYKRLELKEKEMDKLCQEHGLKEKMLNDRSLELELKQKEIDDRFEALNAKEKENDDLSKGLELKEKEIKELHQALEEKEKEKQINELLSARGLQEKQMRSYHSIPIKISSFCKNMNANGVRSYLIKHVKELDLLHEEILNDLSFALDPAKLVLDVFRSFHKANSAKRCNKTVCIFLLDLLMKLEIDMPSEVKDEAGSYAKTWRDKLRNNSPVDTFRFLLFLAAFKLVRSFEATDLIELFGTLYNGYEVCRYDLHIKICRTLGILNRIPGQIRRAIQRKRLLQAVKLICVFKMEHRFPPVPLLKYHLECVMQKTEAQNGRNELSSLRSILKCISDFNLKSDFSSESIIARIKQLEKIGKNDLPKSLRIAPKFHSKQAEEHTTYPNSVGSKTAEVDSCRQTVSGLPTPANTQGESQAGVKRSSSLTTSPAPSECQKKRPRVKAAHSVAPLRSVAWPQSRPHSFGQATYVTPDETRTWPRGPYPPLNGPNPNFGVPHGLPGVTPHWTDGQFVTANAYPVNIPVPFYDARGQAWEPPRMP